MRWGILLSLTATALVGQTGSFLTWTLKQAQTIAVAQRLSGRVNGGIRGLHTERAFNYKLRATWLTPDVIRACSRIQQLKRRLSDLETERLVTDAEAVEGAVFMIELDPNEGSGVIPSAWSATLSPVAPKGAVPLTSRGVKTPSLESVLALNGVGQRDYDYDVFWMVFPLRNEKDGPLFTAGDKEAELDIQIDNKSGRVRFPIPDAIGSRAGLVK